MSWRADLEFRGTCRHCCRTRTARSGRRPRAWSDWSTVPVCVPRNPKPAFCTSSHQHAQAQYVDAGSRGERRRWRRRAGFEPAALWRDWNRGRELPLVREHLSSILHCLSWCVFALPFLVCVCTASPSVCLHYLKRRAVLDPQQAAVLHRGYQGADLAGEHTHTHIHTHTTHTHTHTHTHSHTHNTHTHTHTLAICYESKLFLGARSRFPEDSSQIMGVQFGRYGLNTDGELSSCSSSCSCCSSSSSSSCSRLRFHGAGGSWFALPATFADDMVQQ